MYVALSYEASDEYNDYQQTCIERESFSQGTYDESYSANAQTVELIPYTKNDAQRGFKAFVVCNDEATGKITYLRVRYNTLYDGEEHPEITVLVREAVDNYPNCELNDSTVDLLDYAHDWAGFQAQFAVSFKDDCLTEFSCYDT